MKTLKRESWWTESARTYVWLNAILMPIAKILAWLFEGAAPRDHDEHKIIIQNEKGEVQESWRGLTPTRAAQTQYWINQMDQAMLSREEELQKTKGATAEIKEREIKKLVTTPKGCHTEINWTRGLQTTRGRMNLRRGQQEETESLVSTSREIDDKVVAPHEITVRVPMCIAQEGIAKLETCIQAITPTTYVWTDAEENVGVNQRNRHRELNETEQIKQTERNKMAKKICMGKEGCFQMPITTEDIIEQMDFGRAILNLQKMTGKDWLDGVEWASDHDRYHDDAKHTPQARPWRIPKGETHSFLTVTIPHDGQEATSAKELGSIQEWPIKNNRTPDKPEYQEIGVNGGHVPGNHTHYTYATTALLLAGAVEPTPGGKKRTLEQQYLRRKDRKLHIQTPKVGDEK